MEYHPLRAMSRQMLIFVEAFASGLKVLAAARGNERMALAAVVTYLEMNGLTWKCCEVEETAMVLRAAAKEMKEDEWEAWVVRNVGKKE
jgi:prophage maintenance system killer protein